VVASRRRALSDCRFVTRRCSNEFRRAASASRVRVLRPSAELGRLDSTEGVRVEGVRVGTVCRCDRSRSIREFCESVRLDEVDDSDSVGLSDPNRERVPNVDCVWGTVVFVESLPIRVTMLRERDTSENDRMRELNVELVEDRFNDCVWGTVVFVELLPIRVAMLCELARPDDDVLGVDGGSTTTKVALINVETLEIVAEHYGRTHGDPVAALAEYERAVEALQHMEASPRDEGSRWQSLKRALGPRRPS